MLDKKEKDFIINMVLNNSPYSNLNSIKDICKNFLIDTLKQYNKILEFKKYNKNEYVQSIKNFYNGQTIEKNGDNIKIKLACNWIDSPYLKIDIIFLEYINTLEV